VSEKLQRQLFQACLLETTARKLGNVHPSARFEHIDYEDFVRSAEAATPILSISSTLGVGQAILNSVRKTQTVCKHNTNLGIAMLLAPLAAVDERYSIAIGIDEVIFNLTNFDALLVYDAIRSANPRGLGLAESEDVATDPTGTLHDVMALAADRDQIAWEYTNGFSTIFEFGVPFLAECSEFETDWEDCILQLQLMLLARRPDTDIARKCGQPEADKSAVLAQAALDAGSTSTDEGRSSMQELDDWLRSRGSLRNPGTTADIVTACLFVAIRDGAINSPSIETIQQQADEFAQVVSVG
jgi:triphosphoribosyl-dephospho-CoA synthase